MCQFTQENDLTIDLLDGYVEVYNAVKPLLHGVQLVVVRGEKREGLVRVFVQVLRDGPSNAHSVVGTRTASDLVQQNQTSLRKVI